MDIIVPEAAGDAGIGFLQSLAKKDIAKKCRIICVGSDLWELPQYMFQRSFGAVEGIELPPADMPEKILATKLKEGLDSFDLQDGFVAPTAECLTGVFLHPVIKAKLELEGISYEWLPTRKAWAISRDKYQLAEKLKDVLVTSLEPWNLPCFAKPRCGSGSKGCHVVRDRRLAEALTDYVFQPYVKGDYFVVDIIETFTVTRKVTRQRDGADTEFVFYRDFDLEEMARRVQEDLPGCPSVLNVQFLYDGEKYWIIDIGTRLSGAVGCLLEYDVNLWDLLTCTWTGPELVEHPIKRYWSAYPCP